MKKKIILLSILIWICMGGFVSALAEELHGSIGVIYDSKYIWRGFDVYGDKSAIHPFVDVDLFGTGFGLNIIAHRANSSEYELAERWDYTVYYQNSAFADKLYAINYRFGYMYYNYPDLSSHTAFNPSSSHAINGSLDLQEVHGIFSFPNILQVDRLVPTYVLVKLWPANSGTLVGAASPSGGSASGFAHIFMLDYGLPMDCPITGKEQMINLHSEFIYNDGVGPDGRNVDQDWSNMVLGISTNYDLGNSFSFVPGVYHQITFDDSVNDDKDETWVSLAVKYSF